MNQEGNQISFPSFKGLDPDIFEGAAEYILTFGCCCCCPAIEHEAWSVAQKVNGPRSNLFQDYALRDQIASPCLLALASVFKPEHISEYGARMQPWWGNGPRSVFEIEPRILALLLCAEFCREAGENAD